MSHFILISTNLQSFSPCSLHLYLGTRELLQRPPLHVPSLLEKSLWTLDTRLPSVSCKDGWLPSPWHTYFLHLSFLSYCFLSLHFFSLFYFCLQDQGETNNPFGLSRLYSWIMTALHGFSVQTEWGTRKTCNAVLRRFLKELAILFSSLSLLIFSRSLCVKFLA